MKSDIFIEKGMKTELGKFRHDIEILRGFSVIIVLLYHFNFNIIDTNFIKAGYIGVDIFFIISGYIITKILIENNKLTLKNFYIKRFKRLAPGLLVVLLGSFFLSIFIFDLFLIKKNSNSSYSVLLGVSNFYFWLTSTIYQFAEKNSMLFLHTWSLAIEFQFYLFYPILLFLFKKDKIPFILLLFFLISYISIFYLYEKHNLFNFYNSFSRVFEIVSGCLIYFYERKIKKNIKKKYYNFLYFLGFILILNFMLFFHDGDNHPNPQSIIFLLGACMMILFYNNNLHFLYNFKVQNIGSISYSLYIWHFPILVISSFYFEEFNDYKKLLSLILCIILSLFSYFLIEKKFRKLSFRKNLYFTSIIIICLVMLSIAINKRKIDINGYIYDNYFLADQSNSYLKNNNNLSLRKSKNIFSFQNDYKKFSPTFSDKDTKKILFIGDSHSKDVFNIFYTNKNYYKKYEFARYGFNLKDIFNKRKTYLLNSETFIKADIIVLSLRYSNEDILLIEKMFKMITSYNKEMILVLKKPEFEGNNRKNKTFVDMLMAKGKKLNLDEINSLSYKKLNRKKFETINEQIIKLYDGKIKILSLYELVCDDIKKKCDVLNENSSKNFYDYGHFTLSGSKYFGLKFINKKMYKKYFD